MFSQLLLSIDIDASGIIKLPNSINRAVNGYRIIYGFLNLEFFRVNMASFCLWRSASALDIMAFKYVTIVYALLLIISVIFFMNKCGWMYLGKCCRITTVRTSVIHGISAFFIICYSQAVKTSLSLLNAHSLKLNRNQDVSNFTLSKRVWLNGELIYFREAHLYYAVPALFCLLTIGILPPLSLITYPLLNKVLDIFNIGDSKAVRFLFRWSIPINNLKPLFDSFQGCFKDHLRFFAGLYFLYRWSAPLVRTITTKFSVAYMAIQFSLTVMLVIHALFHPYISQVHNIIDTLLFADLALINFITLINYVILRNKEFKFTTIGKSAVFQLVLIYTPLVLFTCYVSVQVVKSIRRCNKRNGVANNSSHAVNIGLTFKPVRMLIRNINSATEHKSDEFSDLPHRLIVSDSVSGCDTETENVQRTEWYREADTFITY